MDEKASGKIAGNKPAKVRQKTKSYLWCKWLGSIFAVGILIISFFLYFIISASGQHRLLYFIDNILTELKIEQVSGDLWGKDGLTITNFQFNNQNINVQVAKTHLQISLRDLWAERKLSIGDISFINPRILLTPTKTTPPSDDKTTSSTNTFNLPFAIELKNLQIDDFELVLLEHGKIQLGHFQTAATFTNQIGLSFSPTIINDLWLDFPKVESEQTHIDYASEIEKNFSDSKIEKKSVDWGEINKRFALPLFSLSDFELPFIIQLPHLEGNNWLFKQSDKSYDQFSVSQFLLEATAQKSTVNLNKLWIKSPVAEVNANGNIQTIADYPLHLTLSGQFDALSPMHYFYDIDWIHLFFAQPNTLNLQATGGLNSRTTLNIQTTGALDADIVVSADLTTHKMPFSVHIKSPYLQYPFDKTKPNPYKFKNVDIQVTGNLLGYQGRIYGEFIGKNIQTAPIMIDVEGDMSEVKINELQLNINQQSQLYLNGELSWRNQLKWQSTVKLKKFDLGKYLPQNVPQLKQLQGFSSVLSGIASYEGYLNFYDNDWYMQVPELSLTGKISQRPFSFITQFEFSPQYVDIPKFELNYHQNKISLHGNISQTTDLVMEINAPNLSGLLPSLHADLRGNVLLKGKGHHLRAKADVVGKNIRFEDFKLNQINLMTDMQDLAHLHGNIHLAIRDITYHEIHFPQIDLQGAGTGENHKVTLISQGTPFALTLNLQGGYSNDFTFWHGTLSQLKIDSPVGDWWIDKAIKITYNLPEFKATIDMNCLLNSHASLCFPKPLYFGQDGDIAFNLKNLELASLNPNFSQNTFKGKVSAVGKVKWSATKSPQMKIDVDGRDVQITQQIDYRHFKFAIPSVKAIANLANNQLTSSANIRLYNPYTPAENRNSQINIAFNVNKLNKERTLTGSAKIERLSLSLLNQLVTADENLKGNISANMQFAGSLKAPLLMGNISVNNVVTNIRSLPFDITQGRFSLDFYGKNAKLDGNIKTAKSALALKGEAQWNGLNKYSAKINVNAKDFYLNLPISPSKIEMKLTPDVTAMVTDKEFSLIGEVDIPWARIFIKDLPDNGVSTSNDLVILDGPNQSKPSKILALTNKQANIDGKPVFSHIKVNIGNDVNLKAYGLDTNLIGVLAITQKEGILGVYGQVDLKDGVFKAYGQNLIIKEGMIGFSGLPNKPTLNLNAIRNPKEMASNDVVAGLRVSGYVDKPIVKVYSIPSMSDDQALSYLITGHSLENNSSSGTRDSLSVALLSMTLAQTGNAVGNIGKLFGIQNLSLGTTGTGDKSQVAVSGNITERLQVSYGVGLFTGLSELTLRLRLLPRLYLQSVSGVNQAVDLFYQFDI